MIRFTRSTHTSYDTRVPRGCCTVNVLRILTGGTRYENAQDPYGCEGRSQEFLRSRLA